MVTENSEIKVSVLCAAYNHEKYIRQCLDGFVMQKTNFKFEVLINDDASTDNTALIIREYEEKYPDIIKPIYQTENQYSKGVKITREILFPYIQGKYIAFCEGDDYWTDENKLQRQFDALEKHTDCTMCVHKVWVVNEKGEKTPYYYPYFEQMEGIIDSRDFLNKTIYYAFQTSSYFLRREIYGDYSNYMQNVTKKTGDILTGDECLILYFGDRGAVYYIDAELSHYRKFREGSWSLGHSTLPHKLRAECSCTMIRFYDSFDAYTEGRYKEAMQGRVNREIYIVCYENGGYGDKALLKFAKDKNERKMFKRRYRKFPFKQRIYYYLKAKFPLLIKYYKRKKELKS